MIRRYGSTTKDISLDKRYKHNQSHSDLYNTWVTLKARCNSITNKNYKQYGGRGIKVCDEWMSYIPFMEWAKLNGHKKGLTIDRIDNNKGYSPSNCRFVDRLVQSNNRSNNILIPIVGSIVNSARFDSNPVPLINIGTNLIGSTSRLITGKKDSTKARGLVGALEAGGILAGVPGAAQAGQFIRGRIE